MMPLFFAFLYFLWVLVVSKVLFSDSGIFLPCYTEISEPSIPRIEPLIVVGDVVEMGGIAIR